MTTKFSDSKQKWKLNASNSSIRDYSFKSASGEEVDLLYYPKDNDYNYSYSHIWSDKYIFNKKKNRKNFKELS